MSANPPVMSEKFTPLTLGALPVAETTAHRTQVSSPATTASPFQSLPSKPANPTDACAAPVVSLQRNAAGVVTSIRVQCGCGRVTDLNCVY